jgi:molecular chaperone DnaK (HSP70)
MSAANWVACIDFGTAFSKAALAPAGAWSRFEPALVRPLALATGDANPFLLDSAVFVDPDSVTFGAAALVRAAAPGNAKRQALRSFKTILSAPDLERALATRATGSIDPTRSFSQRDLVVLYLSFLTHVVEAAIAADAKIKGAIAWRYASPAWREDGVAAHRVIERLFGEARVVRSRLAASLGQGVVKLADARASLEAAASAEEAALWRMDLVYEATAAAACSAIALTTRASHVIVIDIGAGTTDIAALAGAEDLHSARITLTQAGDFLDRVLLNQALAASPQLKSAAQQAGLWAAMAPLVRDLKESLFADGRAVFRHEGRVISLTLRDFERDKPFKQFEKDLTHAYTHALKLLRERARKDKQKQILAVAVGGGAPAPFIQKLIRTPAPGGGLRVVACPPTPDWAKAPAFAGNLAPVFPQLSVAIGGALAPDEMLAAYDRASA